MPKTVRSKFRLTSLLLLVSLIFSGLSHSHAMSSDEQSVIFEQLDCKLCQIHVQLPKQNISIIEIKRVSFYLQIAPYSSMLVVQDKRSLPEQRAPPYC